ncbi:MAG TPA: rod shape-determining protein RodA [Blastocatellia bacterium]|nr:rod shape-determining protein RodA [Blastocatellia bacterium]
MFSFDTRSLRDFDWPVLVIPVVLVCMGTVFIYSSQPDQPYWKKQLVWLAAGIVAAIVFALNDYRKWLRLAPFFYGFALFWLVAVLVCGQTINGAKAWINFGSFSFQPAELSKLATILMLAKVLSKSRRAALSFKEIAIACVVVAAPCALILAQPDTGTVLTFFPVLLAMLFLSGLRKRMLVIAIVGGTLAIVLAWGLVLKPYQKERMKMAFTLASGQTESIDSKSRRGQGYQSIQSMIAVGSGGPFGKGVLQGTQGRLGFLPERHTDFIASILAEETGFAGTLAMLFLYSILLWRLIGIARLSADRFGALIVMGIAALLVFHIFVNLGMVVGLMPIMGIPLPLLSYGGSSLLMMFMGFGLALSVRLRRFVN